MDYTDPITGTFTFVDGDTVTISNWEPATKPAGAVIADNSVITSSGLLTLSYSDVDGATTGITGITGIRAMNGGVFTSTGTVVSKGTFTADGAASAINLVNVEIATPAEWIFGYGLQASNSATIDVTGNTKISTQGDSANGVLASSGSTINLVEAEINTRSSSLSAAGGTINSTGTVTLNSTEGNSVAFDNGIVTLNNVDATAKLSGLYLYRNSSAKINGQLTVNSEGVGVQTLNSSTLTANDANITTSGDNAAGVLSMITISGSTLPSTTFNGQLTVNTTGNNSNGVHIAAGSSSFSDVDITTMGDNSAGLAVTGGATAAIYGDITIHTSGDNSDGVQLLVRDTAAYQNTFQGDTTITTTGDNADALNFIGATANTTAVNLTFDSSNPLPTLKATGKGSALVSLGGAHYTRPTVLTLTDQTLSMEQSSKDSWGVMGGDQTNINLTGSTDLGGTGLWLKVYTRATLQDIATLAGSRVKIDDLSVFTLSGTDNSATIGSLEGEGYITFSSAGGNLIIGQNNTQNNGSMADNADFSGTLTNVGTLTKTGDLTQILSGINTVGNVVVDGGTLKFAQPGAFTTTGDYTTKTGGTTDVGTGSTLSVGGSFTQQEGSALVINVEGMTGPGITANTATLDGNLTIDGVTADINTPTKASEITGKSITLIHTTGGITGDFDNNTANSGLDYLLADGSSDGFDYSVGYRMAWTDGGQTQGTGTFTLAADTAFEVDTVLADQSGTFDSGWDGKSLTKAGDGKLILSGANTYTGGTTLEAGTLQLVGAGTLGAVTGTTMVKGGTLDLGTTTQTQATLTQSGGAVNNGTMNVGTYQLTGGELGTTATVNASTLFDMQSGTVSGMLGGAGALQKTTDGTITIKGVSQVGSVNVQGGTLSFGQTGAFTVTGGYAMAAGATTVISDGATLAVGGAYTQADNSTLNVTLADPTRAAITADSATLSGDVVFNGFAANGSEVVSTSQIAQDAQSYILITTQNGITGDLTVGSSMLELPDYLLGSGQVTSDGRSYEIKDLNLAWTDGGQAAGTGTFTMAANTAFNIDTVLSDQSGTFDSGWDGKSLTKAGEGMLVVSAAQAYTGSTTLEGGGLRTDVDNALASSSNVTVNGGTLNLNGHDQTLNKLAGIGGQVALNGAMLTVNNATSDDSTRYDGNIVDSSAAAADSESVASSESLSGNVTKTGEGSLTLGGVTGWTGTTTLEGGALILDGSLGGAQLISNVTGMGGTNLSLKNGASVTGTDVSVGSGSTWNITDDSHINALSLTGNIKFDAPAGDTLTVHNWTGNGGTVALNTVMGDDQSTTDKIVIDGGSATGSTKLIIHHNGESLGAETVNGIKVVDATNGGTTSADAFYLSSESDGYRAENNTVAAGAYDYRLVRGSSTAPGSEDDWFLTSDETFRPETGAYLNNKLAASTMQFYTLHDRSDANQAQGVWLRITGETSERDGVGGQNLSGETYRVHMGGDVLELSDGGKGNFILGVMGQYSSNDNESEGNGLKADGSVSGYSLGLYGTWYADAETHKGTYVDTWIMSGKFDNKVKGEGLTPEYYNSRNTAVSLETRYALPVYENDTTVVSVEPQAQVIYSNYQGDQHKEHNGTWVSDQSDDSTTTRLGVRVSGDIKTPDVQNLTVFAETNWWHGPDSQSVTFDGTKAEEDLPADRIEGKVGVRGNLTKSISLSGTLGFEGGAENYKAGTAQIGLKYTW